MRKGIIRGISENNAKRELTLLKALYILVNLYIFEGQHQTNCNEIVCIAIQVRESSETQGRSVASGKTAA